jgi:carbon starvation protein
MRGTTDDAAVKRAETALKAARAQRSNNLLDAVVTGVFLLLVILVVLISVREWLLLLAGRKPDSLRESAPVWLPLQTPSAGSPISVLGVAALGFTLLKEVSGQAAVDRANTIAEACNCAKPLTIRARQNVFLTATEERFRGINRCC